MSSQRLSKHDALKLLRYCLEEGVVQYHPHFYKRCLERHVDPVDAQYILRKGAIFSEPEFEVRFQEWRYKIEGKSPDGGLLKVVFTFVDEEEVLILTVMNG